MPLESRNDQRRQVVVLLLFGVLTVLVASKLGQIAKTRQKLEQKKVVKLTGYTYACNSLTIFVCVVQRMTGKRKLCEFSEVCL